MPALRRGGTAMEDEGRGNCANVAPNYWGVGCLLFLLILFAPSATSRARSLEAQAPAPDTMMFYKALDLEAAGKYREAAPLFRSALRSAAVGNALLGLERVYAALGW